MATRCDRLSTDSSCWRLAVLDFRNFWCGPLQVCCLMTLFQFFYSHNSHVVVEDTTDEAASSLFRGVRVETPRRFSSSALNRSFSFWRHAVLGFRLLRLFGSSLCSTVGLARLFGESPCSIFGWLVILATRCDRLSTDSSCWRLSLHDRALFPWCAPAGVLSHYC